MVDNLKRRNPLSPESHFQGRERDREREREREGRERERESLVTAREEDIFLREETGKTLFYQATICLCESHAILRFFLSSHNIIGSSARKMSRLFLIHEESVTFLRTQKKKKILF